MRTDLTHQTIFAVGCGTPDGEINNGLAAALAFGENGARVFIVDRDKDALALASGRLAERNITHATALADVTDEDSIAKALNECRTQFEDPSVLYYNVGIVKDGGPTEITTDDFISALKINVAGAFTTIRLVLPAMIKAKYGRIITVSSVGGIRSVGYNYPAYSSSKAALIELTKSVGIAYAKEGIRANTIAPGFIASPLVAKSLSSNYSTNADMLKRRNAASPTGEMGRPEDIASAAVFLASKAADYINAALIPVDGGLIHTTPN